MAGKEMTTEQIFDLMEETLDKAVTVPFSGGKSVVNVEKLRDLMTELRMSMPQEFNQARSIVADRNSILSSAKKEAELTVRVAEEKAQQLISESEIVKQAQARANEIMTQTRNQVKEIRSSTNDYVENVLKNVDESLVAAINDVRHTRQTYKNAVAASEAARKNENK